MNEVARERRLAVSEGKNGALPHFGL